MADQSAAAREPAAVIAAISACVGAVLTLAVTFGLDLTGEQQAAILGITATVLPLIVGALIRPHVTPNGSVLAREEHTTVLKAMGGSIPIIRAVAGPASTIPDGTRVTVHPAEGA